MLFSNVFLESVSAYLPPHIISSEDIEEQLEPLYNRLGLAKGRLELFTGIKQRRAWDTHLKPSDVATKAGELAMQEAQVRADEIDCLIHCSVCRDFLEPATASVIHSRLGLPSTTLNFDISNACLGMMTGVDILANLIALGRIKRGLLVSGEIGLPLTKGTISKLNNNPDVTRKSLKHDFASLTIGSGASAMLISCEDVLKKQGHKYLGQSSHSATQYNYLCQGDVNYISDDEMTFAMATDSQELLLRGVQVAKECWDIFQKEFWKTHSVDKAISHQVGIAHRNLLFEELGLCLDKDYTTFDYFGNCGSSSLPLTLALAQQDNYLKPNEKVALLAIGSGINCSIGAIQW